MQPELQAGTAIMAAIESVVKLEQPGAVLMPRLVVHGDGTGSLYAYNLKISNTGKEPAFGVQVAVPLSSLVNGKTVMNSPPSWWEVTLLRPYSAIAWLGRYRPLNWLRRWAMRRSVLLSKDVGLSLAPGESVELYFGEVPIRGPADEQESMQWQVGQITKVFLLWHTGMPYRWQLGRFKRHRASYLAISTAVGSDICAHTVWKKG